MTTSPTPSGTRTPRVRAVNAAVAAALLLVTAACGGDDDSASDGTTEPGTSPLTTEATDAVPTDAAATTAASGGTSTGVTDDTITISVSAGFTGPFGDLFSAWAADGYGLWADEVNAAGGINGRAVELKTVDHFDTAEGGVAACREVESNGSFMAIVMVGFGGADTSMADCLDAAGIPVVARNLSTFDEEWSSVISPYASGKQAAPLASFIKTQMDDPDPKVGLIVTDDPIHLGGRDALVPELERLDIEVVGEEIVAPGQGSFVAELTRLQGSGATTVAMVTATESMGIVRDAASIGYAPAWTGLYWTLDDLSQGASDLWTGIVGLRGYPTVESEAFRTYADKAAEFGHEALVTTTVMGFYGDGLLVGDILDAAGEELTREAVPTAAESLGDYDNGIWRLTFGPGIREPDVAMYPVECCGTDKNWVGTADAEVVFE